MRILLFSTAVILAFAPCSLFANPLPWGPVAPYADAAGTDHYIFDDFAGTLLVYIVQNGIPGAGYTALGVSFSAPAPSCLVGAWLYDVHVFPATTGNSQTGVAIQYGVCQNRPVHVLTIAYSVQGLTPECCFYWTLPHPSTGLLEETACDGTVWGYTYSGGAGIINPDRASYCGTPVEPSTWGKVKALYR